jgi:reactive intermediate/imine deaminase
MPQRTNISTDAAPEAIGTYSQAVRVGDTVYLSGQIPLVANTMELVSSAIDAQIEQVISNLHAVAEAAGGSLDEFVRVTVFLTNLGDFTAVSEAMARHFTEPYPARAALGVSALPRGALVEMDAVMVLGTRG